MQFNELEPHELPESDLSQIEAFDQGLTSDPGCWTQPVEFSEPERKFDTEEADRYDAWVEGMHEAHCKELGLNPETGEPGRATRVPRGGRDGIRGSKQKWRATEMDYGYLGDVVPGAIVAFLVPLAFIAGLITVVTIRSRYSNRAGWLPRRVHRVPTAPADPSGRADAQPVKLRWQERGIT